MSGEDVVMSSGEDVNGRNELGGTPLHAAEYDNEEAVKALGVVITQRSHAATYECCYTRTSSASTRSVAKEGHVGVVQVLVGLGADVHAKNHKE